SHVIGKMATRGRGSQLISSQKSKTRNQMDECAESNPGWAFCEEGLGVVVPCRSGDIEVNPRRVTRELADEPSASDGAAAFAAADILNVRETPLDEFAILIVHRHLPHFFTCGFGRSEELVSPRLVRTEDADVHVGQRNDDGTGQRSGVNKMCSAKL